MDISLAEIIASLLWKEGAVQFNSEIPFVLHNGNFTPIYFNCRKLIWKPSVRNFITSSLFRLLDATPYHVDVIAGGESAGIPFATSLADMMGKNLLYVRKSNKVYGTKSQIEGADQNLDAKNVVLVEDLIMDGKSKTAFIDALRGAEMNVVLCMVVMDRQQGGEQELKRCGISLKSLTNFTTVIQVGKDNKYLSDNDYKEVISYVEDPKNWNEKRRLSYKT